MSFNAASKTSKIVLSNSDRMVALTTGSGIGSVLSLDGFSSGKRYFEFDFVTRTNSNQWIGFCAAAHSLFDYPGQNADSWGLQIINTASGAGLCRAYHNGAYIEYADRLIGNDGGLVRVAIDMDNKKVWYSTDSILWPASPTNPASGFAHDFSAATGPFYIVFYGGRDFAYSTSGQGNFTAAQMSYAIPAGYVGFADGGATPAYLDLGTGALTFAGQSHAQEGGVLPAYLDVQPGFLAFKGNPSVPQGGQWQNNIVQLDHARAGPELILNGRLPDGGVYAPPVRSIRSQLGGSALLWQLLSGGKWYVEYSQVGGLALTYPYDNLRVGLARGNAPLNGMLGGGDEYMFTLGAWNAPAYLMHFGELHGASRANSSGNGSLLPKGIAIDLTDTRDGKLWYHNGGHWGQGDPVAGTTPDWRGFAGAWFVAASAQVGFELAFIQSPAYQPAGFTNVFGSAPAAIAGLWGNGDIRIDVMPTLTVTPTDLILEIGNHLLRSATWHKRGQYWLGLLETMTPAAEPQAAGYARQPMMTGDSYWSAQGSSLSAFTFPLFDAALAGWGLFATETGASLVFARPFASPITVSAAGPALAFPANQFTWSAA